MTNWVPLHSHTTWSLLDGLSRPDKIARKCADLGYGSFAGTDHGNIGATVSLAKVLKEVGVKHIKGCEFYLCRDDATIRTPANARPYSHLCVLAKNLKGWRNLIAAVSRSNSEEYAYYHPRLNLEDFRDFAGDLIAFSGHPGSDLGNIIFRDPKAAYACDDYEELKAHHIHPDAAKRLEAKASQYVSVFGRGNFFLEVQILDPEGMPACLAIAKALRWLSSKTKIPCVATADSHYVNREDAYDQRVLLAAKLRTTMSSIRRRIENEEAVELGGFFRGDHFHIPTPEEMAVHHLPEELRQSLEIAEMCEDYDILSPPKLPHFECPGGTHPNQHLRDLCEAGFRSKVEDRGLDIAAYRERLEMELGVIEGAGLSPYFLVVQDILAYAKDRGWLVGPGRGSAAGCLVSYLAGITKIDPIPYGLLFERFYNAGRNAPGRISMPDIDIDVPIIKRDELIPYLQKKYGKDRVAKIATFSSLQGRSALDEVLSVHEVPFDLRKQITKVIPDKARISEELQEMKDEGEEPSIIRYAMEIYGEELSEWVRMGDDGSLEGEFAPYFAQAIRLEGTKKHVGTHAAGVVISPEPLASLCPLKYEKGDDCYKAEMEYPDLEAMGLMKLDLLGIAMLNKGEGVRDQMLTGEIQFVG